MYDISNKVMLSMLCRHNEYKKQGGKHVAKFFPHYDGPYLVIDTPWGIDLHPGAPKSTQHLPHIPCFRAHTTHHEWPVAFPNCKEEQLPLIITPDDIGEYFVEEILDAHHVGMDSNISSAGQATDSIMIAGSLVQPLKTAKCWIAG